MTRLYLALLVLFFVCTNPRQAQTPQAVRGTEAHWREWRKSANVIFPGECDAGIIWPGQCPSMTHLAPATTRRTLP